jgi:hypothetical protein
MEATAALCLENAPPYHRHYIHTSGSRSYGYLMADGHTFFAIIDPTVGNVGAFQFLERVREEFRNTNRNGLHDSLVPAVQRLVASLEKMPRATLVLEYGTPRGGGSNDRCLARRLQGFPVCVRVIKLLRDLEVSECNEFSFPDR